MRPLRRFVPVAGPLLAGSLAALAGCVDDPSVREPGLGAATPDPAALRASLSAAMSGHRTLPYDAAWTALAEAHAVGADGIRLFYSRAVIPAANRASGADQAEPDFWNREHLWPQSYGLRDTGARTDLHNLVPADRTINSSRGAKFYDEVSGAHHECARCEVSREAWEPPAEVKGDVARALFYVDVRYEGEAFEDVPDLVLGDVPDADARRFGVLGTLLAWHCEDPVSVEEVRRHEVVARVQGNRNAFVDSPSLVEGVYGERCEG